jgi:TldD protein
MHSSIFLTTHGVTTQDLESYLAAALERGGDYADLFFELKINHSITFEEHILKGATKAVNLGVGVRVLSGEKTGYAYSEDLNRNSVLKAAKTAAFIAKSASAGGTLKIDSPKLREHDLYSMASLPADLEIGAKLLLLRQADEAAHAYDKRIQQVQATYVDETRHILLVLPTVVVFGTSNPWCV